MDTELQNAIRALIDDLVHGNYAQLAADGRVGRLSEGELRGAVTQYGKTLIALPEDVWSLVEEYPSESASAVVALDVPLWTKEEGRSDLTLSLTATKSGDQYHVEIDDLHVL